jgi:hypothetical protein
MPTIVATKDYPYGTRKLKVGDRFEATERDADLLVKVGMAKPVKAKPATAKPDAVKIDVAEDKPKRQYKRRDMQPEE